jgi:diadenosine tetraphosphate (Ap4A) HIT family hydrolase
LGEPEVTSLADCPLCQVQGEDILWQDEFCRVMLAADADFPGFCRVILQSHVSEMTDLEPAERERLMRVVYATEGALREVMRPDKINLASLGNMVPHLHWHVIPRFRGDSRFPDPIWAAARRVAAAVPAPARQALAARLRQELG